MGEVRTILDLIESVDPSDVQKLDEIDARVIAYIHQWHAPDVIADYCDTKTGDRNYWERNYKEYTRSRDALKAIRPEGYWFGVDENGTKGWQASMNDPDRSGRNFIITGMPTEELAELHAIIQAIAYERAQ